jgi:hypothetical protein
MTAGIFALAGVLVGAFSTAVSTWFFERRKEKCSLTVAARLVREDVVQAGPCLETLLRRGWFEGLDLEIVSWPEQRAQLAASLPKDAWDEIANAMAGVARIQIMISELLKVQGEFESDAIPMDGRDVTLQVLKALRDASDHLDRIA